MIETNRFLLQKEGVNKIKLGIKRTQCAWKMSKRGSIELKLPPSSSIVVPPWAHKFLHRGYLNNISCRFFNTFSTLPFLKHYSSSHNEETYEMISNLKYNFIPKCVFMCGNLSTTTQMTLEYIMQIRLIITIYVINGTRRVYIYMHLCIFPGYINGKYSV